MSKEQNRLEARKSLNPVHPCESEYKKLGGDLRQKIQNQTRESVESGLS